MFFLTVFVVHSLFSEDVYRYGLILPKKGSSQEVIQRPAIFDDGSDSDGSSKEGGDWVKKSYQVNLIIKCLLLCCYFSVS